MGGKPAGCFSQRSYQWIALVPKGTPAECTAWAPLVLPRVSLTCFNDRYPTEQPATSTSVSYGRLTTVSISANVCCCR